MGKCGISAQHGDLEDTSDARCSIDTGNVYTKNHDHKCLECAHFGVENRCEAVSFCVQLNDCRDDAINTEDYVSFFSHFLCAN